MRSHVALASAGYGAFAVAEKMKLGDAMIAATALEYGQALVTRTVHDSKHIPGRPA